MDNKETPESDQFPVEPLIPAVSSPPESTQGGRVASDFGFDLNQQNTTVPYPETTLRYMGNEVHIQAQPEPAAPLVPPEPEPATPPVSPEPEPAAPPVSPATPLDPVAETEQGSQSFSAVIPDPEGDNYLAYLNEMSQQAEADPYAAASLAQRDGEMLRETDAWSPPESFVPELQPAMQSNTKPQDEQRPDGASPNPVDEEMFSQATTRDKTAENQSDEVDGIVYGPRRPEPQQREDLDKIIKALSTEEQRDNTVLYRLDGQDAFRDMGNRLEMSDGASQDKRKVLAALAIASRFYGGVVELTGSPEFKQQAMRLIIENDLDIRMKIPAQRAQLDELRKQMGVTNDAIATHIPTPDLNRHTPSPDVAPQMFPDPVSEASAANPAAPGPVPQGTASAANATVPAAPVSSGPVPQVPTTHTPPTFSASAPMSPSSPQTDSIRVPVMAEEPSPSALKPGESVTAVLKDYGEAMYENKEQRGNSFFIELQNRGGSHTYWGQDLRKLIADHKAGDVVTLTLNSRDSWKVPGEDRDRVKNNWSLSAAPTGIAVAHDRPEQGQPLQAFPVDTFSQVTQQICQAWPEHTADLKLPPRLEERQFYLGEDRHPVKASQNAASITPPAGEPPTRLIPVMASMDTHSRQMELLLVQSAGEHLQGVVRLNGTLYPALASPTADSKQLVINAITDDGPRFAGYGQAVNFEPDGTTRAAPQLMTFHLKGREEDAPLPARLYTPEKQDDTLFQRLGFEQTWKQWDDARKPEGRQEKALHQEHSHSPGR